MKLILYGAPGCKKCESLQTYLRGLGVLFEFKDANADENAAECDRHNVDKLPHVIQINPDTGDAIAEWVGTDTSLLIQQLTKKR